jgi:hypothetical protein
MAFQGYKYEQLDKTKQQIRLLFLHPSERHSVQVQCTIAVVPLEKAPLYNALSYCWGDASIQVAIKLQNYGSALTSRLFVTSNLYSALRRIRSKIEYIPLRIDAVCIYLDRHQMEYCAMLRLRPLLSEGFPFVLDSQVNRIAHPSPGQPPTVTSVRTLRGSRLFQYF